MKIALFCAFALAIIGGGTLLVMAWMEGPLQGGGASLLASAAILICMAVYRDMRPRS